MYDFVVIGSGVSGGRIAYELVQGGAKCLLLEAGKALSAKSFPNNELDYSTQLFWGGGVEVSKDGRLGFLRAKVLGGTSIVNQALYDRFDDLAWSTWREATGAASFNVDIMSPFYEAVEKTVSLQAIPPSLYNRNAQIFTKSFNARGYGWHPVHRAQGDCKLEKGSDCIVCLGGCPRDSKQSTLITVIRRAIEKGLEVQAEVEVGALEYNSDHVVIRALHRGQKQEYKGRKVVLAAGAFGNTALLFRSGLGKKLPALGKGFACHPQFMTYAVFEEPVDSHKGAFQAVASDDKRFRERGIKLENVYAGPIGTAMLINRFGTSHMATMKKYRYMASMEVAVRDDALGRLTPTKGGGLVIHKALTSSDRKKVKFGREHVVEFFKTAGAKEVVVCDQAFGLHLMGGCRIGNDAAKSVVSPEFTLHGLPNLIAADSSVFPGAPGINPSFSIAAVSTMAARGVLR